MPLCDSSVTYTRAVWPEPSPADLRLTIPAHLLEPGELLQLADGLRVLHYREEVAEKATAELVAGKGI